jgi:hypothetical protein
LTSADREGFGGGERLRVWTMNFFRYGFVVGMGLAVLV